MDDTQKFVDIDPFEDGFDAAFEQSTPGEETENLPPITVLVNAGFGRRSYECTITTNSTMVVPDPLVKELDLHPLDELDFRFDEEEGVLYISKKECQWDTPDWLQE